jgi:hypothetical protein
VQVVETGFVSGFRHHASRYGRDAIILT